MIRSALLLRSACQTCTSGLCLLSGRTPAAVLPQSSACLSVNQCFHHPLVPKVQPLVRYHDVTTQKFTVIYTLPHIKLLRVISRLKLLQTAITVIIVPPVCVMYSLGFLPLSLVSYTTGIAVFAGVMLYTVSHFIRRVVGMMYLDPSQTTLKVSHLNFWGKRHDIYLPVSDIMTLSDTGDAVSETIVKLKRYSSSETLYFSTHYGRVVDMQGFQKVFRRLK